MTGHLCLPRIICSRRAAAQLKLQDFAAALADSGAALAVQPHWAKALYRKAAALQGLGRIGPAAEVAQQALAAEPSNKGVQALQRQLEAAAAAAAPAVAGAAAAADAAAAGAAAAGPPADPSSPTKPAPTAALLPPLLAGAAFEYVPPADGIHENLLLLLHGLGDKPAAFGRMARQMALPQASAGRSFCAISRRQGRHLLPRWLVCYCLVHLPLNCRGSNTLVSMAYHDH